MKLKERIHQACVELIEGKIASINQEMQSVQESAISDTKSSMGDKYETGREMMMQEKNRLGAQLDLMVNHRAAIHAIDPKKSNDEVRRGSIVQTDHATFYISAPLGEIAMEDDKVFAISEAAPLAKAMKGKKAKDSFSFNNKTYTITHLE